MSLLLPYLEFFRMMIKSWISCTERGSAMIFQLQPLHNCFMHRTHFLYLAQPHSWRVFYAAFSFKIEGNFWISILLDVGNWNEINVLTSNFILLGDQLSFELARHPEIQLCSQTKCLSLMQACTYVGLWTWINFNLNFYLYLERTLFLH